MPNENEKYRPSEEDIHNEVQRLLRFTAERSGVSVNSFSTEIITETVETARENLVRKNAEGAYKDMYLAAKAEAESLKATLRATQQLSPAGATSSKPTSYEVARARTGDGWHRMSSDQKLSSMSIAPESFDHALARDIFGAGGNSIKGHDLLRCNPRKYYDLREGSLALNYFGKPKA